MEAFYHAVLVQLCSVAITACLFTTLHCKYTVSLDDAVCIFINM